MPKLFKYTEDKVPETQSNDSCEFDFEDALGDVLNKRYDQERRAAELLSEQFDTSDLPEEEYNTLFTQMFDKVRAEDEAMYLQKKRSLRRIKTFRTQAEIKSAIDAGHKILKQKVIPSKEIPTEKTKEEEVKEEKVEEEKPVEEESEFGGLASLFG